MGYECAWLLLVTADEIPQLLITDSCLARYLASALSLYILEKQIGTDLSMVVIAMPVVQLII